MNFFIKFFMLFVFLISPPLAVTEPEPEEWFNHWTLDPPAGCETESLSSFGLYVHYCEQENRYPIIYDRNCYPLSIDHLEKTINHTSKPDPYLLAFIDHFHRNISQRPEVIKRAQNDILLAVDYAHQHHVDCQHESVWLDQFSEMMQTAEPEQSWFQYCVLALPYSMVTSRHTGRVYDPNLFEARIQDPDTPAEIRQWMKRWMEKFNRLLLPTGNYFILASVERFNANRYAEHHNIRCE